MLITSTPMSAPYVRALVTGSEEQVPTVLPASNVHQAHTRRNARQAQAVGFRGHDSGNVRAVAVVVGRHWIDATRNFAGPVDERDVGHEVAGQCNVHLTVKVGVRCVDSGVDDPDEDAPIAGIDLAGVVGADHREAPLGAVERVHAGSRAAAGLLALADPAAAACDRRSIRNQLLRRGVIGDPADRPLARRRVDGR